MTDLTDFLLARIAEEEEVARRAAFGYGAAWISESDDAEGWSVVHADGQRDMVGCEDRDVTQHIARHDPARVLTECESKRWIVGWFQTLGAMVDRDVMEARHNELLHVLAALARPYADHPDYREAWGA